MTRIDDIKQAVSTLSPDEMAAFRAWFDELQEQLWDEQIERDEKGGKLDWLVDEALAEHTAGQTRRLR